MIRKLRLLLRENKFLRTTIRPFVVWIMNDVFGYRRLLLQRYGYKALESVMAAAESSGVSCYADFGTLLGIIRDGGFIRHDDDMDFSVLNRNPGLKLFFEELESEGFFFERYIRFDGRVTEFSMRYKEVSVDFFLPNLEGDAKTFKFFFDKKEDYWSEYNYASVSRLVDFKVRGVHVKIPENFNDVLTSYYGEWKVPVAKWNDNMGPRFKKNFEKHYRVECRDRDEWVAFLSSMGD